MNSYIFLNQKNTRINDIPPRLMWNIVDDWSNSTSGYCGETSILSAGLLYGQYVPMYLVRQLLADYFYSLWGSDSDNPSSKLKDAWENYYGGWDSSGSPGGDYKKRHSGSKHFKKWFKDRRQYYCQVLLQIGNSSGSSNLGFQINEQLLGKLHLHHEQFSAKTQHTKDKFIPWIKKHVMNNYPVIIGVQDFLAGSNDPDYDHIVLVIGWGSNHKLTNTKYFEDDEIVLIDHGLTICGQQPHGGSIPYYFRYVMETQTSINATGGWLPDGGCPDPANPAWNFIMDLGQLRKLNSNGQPKSNGAYTCNTYQLANSPSILSDGNAGVVIKGLSDTLPTGVHVRIDTDYYQVPCITANEAKTGIMPSGQMMNHVIKITGLDASLKYNLWLFEAGTTAQINKIPTSGFNEYGKSNNVDCHSITGQTSVTYPVSLKAHKALFARCVLETDG
jgi:hypothetical protein